MTGEKTKKTTSSDVDETSSIKLTTSADAGDLQIEAEDGAPAHATLTTPADAAFIPSADHATNANYAKSDGKPLAQAAVVPERKTDLSGLPSSTTGIGIAIVYLFVVLINVTCNDILPPQISHDGAPVWSMVLISLGWFVYCIVKIHSFILSKNKHADVFTPRRLTILAIASAFLIHYYMSLVGYFSQPRLAAGDMPFWLAGSWAMQYGLLYCLWNQIAWSRKLGRVLGQKNLTEQAKHSNYSVLFPVCLVGLFPVLCLVLPPVFAYSIYFIRNRLTKMSGKGDLERLATASNTLEGKERVVIKYRVFAAVEEWVKQRWGQKSSNNESPLKPLVAAVSGFLLWYLVAYLVWSIWGHSHVLEDLFAKLLPVNVGYASATNGAAINGNIIVFQCFFYGFLSSLILLILYCLTQPDQLEIGRNGIRLYRGKGDKGKVDKGNHGSFMAWSEMSRVDLYLPGKKTNPSEGVLKFSNDRGGVLTVRLGCLRSVEDKELVLKGIENWAPALSRSAEVIQALQPPANHSYTELWLQALAAPPKREKLKPLIEGAIIREGLYTVVRSIGVGGQGFAYLATDNLNGRSVVLKEFLLPVFVDMNVRKKALEKFENEAKILKQLNHPQIVKLEDFFIEDHRAYLVLEHIDGLSMRKNVKNDGKIGEEQVRKLALQMCSILSYLHSLSPPVVHRDFTPDNLILRKDGTLKVIDFNVAQQIESTATGSIVGKHAYLPPEQFRGNPSAQSDIYALGATLYYLLTGEDPEPISESHPKEICHAVSDQLDAIVAKATRTSVEERYATVEELALALGYNVENARASSASSIAGADESLGKQPLDRSQSTPASILADQPGPHVNLIETPGASEVSVPEAIDAGIADSIGNSGIANSGIGISGEKAVDALPPPASNVVAKAVVPPQKLTKTILSSLARISDAVFYFAIAGLLLTSVWTSMPSSLHPWFDPEWYANRYLYRGHQLDSQNRPDAAILEYSKAISQDPNCYEAYDRRGYLYFARNDLEKAMPDALKCVSLRPHDDQAYYPLIQISSRLKKYQQTIDACDHYLGAKDPPPVERKAEYSINSALNAFLKPDDTLLIPIYRYRASSELQVGQYARAIKDFEYIDSILVDRLVLRDRFMLAGAYAFSGETDKARTIFVELCRPEVTDPELFQSMLYCWGIDKAHESRSSAAYVGVGRAIGFLCLDRVKEAKEELESTIALTPDCSALYTMLGYCYAGAQGSSGQTDSTKALALFNKAIALDAHDPVSLILRAKLQIQIGHYEQAWHDSDRAVQLGEVFKKYATTERTKADAWWRWASRPKMH